MFRYALFLLLVSVVQPGGVAAQLRASFHPAEVVAYPPDPVAVFLVVENAGTAAMPVSVSRIAPPGIEAVFEEALPDTLAAGASVVRRVRIAGAPRGESGEVLFSVTGRVAEEPARVAFATLEVSKGATLSASDVIDVEIQTSLTSLTDRSADTVFLVVSNKTGRPVEVDSIRVRGPAFIAFTPSAPTSVPVGSSRLVEVGFSVKDRVRPGGRTLVFEVPVSWDDGAGTRRGRVHVPHEVEVAVLGESEILTALSVPSFLLLPGFLMVVAFGFVFERLGRAAGVAGDVKSEQFWLLAVTLSLVLAAVTRWKYLVVGYGAQDLARIWSVSVVLGGVAALGRHLQLTRREEKKEREERRREEERRAAEPSPGDEPLETLKKISRKLRRSTLPKVTFSVGEGGTLEGFRLWKKDDEEVWVAPEIRYRAKAGASDEDLRTLAGIEEELDRILEQPEGSIERLDELESVAELFYAGQTGLSGPTSVAEDEISSGPEGRYLVPA